ncbi:segregation and condensation protein A [Candidatus Puniceispirillum marinum]|uniref:Segregation and condensation protein A n=1 Tax=Puniceispirillum marinum (strain IMCC1322) TaxID=488538 RepID=D5BQU8_PUNMI|nr:ScpA family protein [Candidatus Puniceispirillum marinum]ADE38662.1 chromosome segregation and condensation protein ScpA [Candidatus Puniceispirillum marinum IMCC1322]
MSETTFEDKNANAEPLEENSAGADQLSLFVNLDGFEGPIDLLLSLSREQKVDLTRISILPLAEQYLEFINNARTLDLEIAADYLVMAAWLAYLKSRLLLPEPEPEQHEEIVDMADALKYQLMRLESMQQASKRLISLPRLGHQRFVRGQSESFSTTTEAIWTASLYDLLACYGDIRSQGESETLTIAATYLYSVQEAAKRLRNLIGRSPEWTVLQQFLPPGLEKPMDRRSATASHFVASLELARDGLIRLRQDSNYAPLYLKSKDVS